MALELQQSPPAHRQWAHYARAKKRIGTGKMRDVALTHLVSKPIAAFCRNGPLISVFLIPAVKGSLRRLTSPLTELTPNSDDRNSLL